MPVSEKNKEWLQKIWSGWRKEYKWDDIKTQFPFPQNLIALYGWFVNILEQRGEDPEEYDFIAYVDPMLKIEENKAVLESIIIAPPKEDMYEQWYEEAKAKIQDEARRAGVLEPYEKEILKLEREAKKFRKRYEKTKQLESKLAEEIREKTAEIERLKLVKMVTVKFKRGYPAFVGYDMKTYGPFKTGGIVSVPEANAAVLIEQEAAVAWVVTGVVPRPPPAPKPLTKEEEVKLRDVYRAALFDELGRVPTDSMSKFRLELEKIKELSYIEAEKHILDLAHEISATVIALKRKPSRVRPPPRVEVYKPPSELYELPRVSPTEPPTHPLEPPVMKFPRSPSSREEAAFWKSFQYKLQMQGYNPWEWQREFNNYISKMQFRSWEALVKAYELFLKTVKEGKELPPLWQWSGVPPPSLNYLPKEIEEKRAGAIIHYTSVEIRNARRARVKPTLEELRKTLDDMMGITGVTFDEIKLALMKAYQEKDVRLTGITLEELESFLEA